MCVESDAAYLVLPNAKSRIPGYFYLSENTRYGNDITQPERNGPLHIVCKTLKHVVASAAEAETGVLFINAQETFPIRYSLHQLGHEQPPTPIKTNNSTALAFVNANIRQKRSKSWDMRYYWLLYKLLQHNLYFYCDKGLNNDADFFHKTSFSKASTQKKMKNYLHKTKFVIICINIPQIL